MTEERVLIDEKKISYDGLISLSGVYRLIMKELDELGYGPYEHFHSEQVFEDKKQIFLEIHGERKLSDYAKVKWEVKTSINQVNEVVVDKSDQKAKMHKGSLEINSMVLLQTDYDKTFQRSAWLYFLRVVIDKFVFKNYISKAMSRAKKDYSQFESKLKSFLNLENFR